MSRSVSSDVLLSSDHRCGDITFRSRLLWAQSGSDGQNNDRSHVRCVLEEGAIPSHALVQRFGITHSYCWRWFIEQPAGPSMALSLDCVASVDSRPLPTSYNSGEFLEAVEIESPVLSLHLGTEDSDAHRSRAERADWMPERLEPELGLHREKVATWVSGTPGGLRIQVPELMEHERIYFHFILAAKPKDANGATDPDTCTWLAVDCHKHELDGVAWARVARL